MANPPPDIALARARWLTVTGLSGDAIGIVADPRHLAGGGYHCGSLDLKSINAVAADDYSIRQPRDRAYYTFEVARGGNFAAATDIGDDWPNGGRAAWLRFNNRMRQLLGANHPDAAAIRGMNYSPDGNTRRRYDCLTDKEGSSSDNVEIHTHFEFWRDTVQTDARARALNLITTAMNWAITGAEPAATNEGTDGMDFFMITDGEHRNGIYWATPEGPFNVQPAEFNGTPSEFRSVTPITWARINAYCEALRQPAAAQSVPEIDYARLAAEIGRNLGDDVVSALAERLTATA